MFSLSLIAVYLFVIWAFVYSTYLVLKGLGWCIKQLTKEKGEPS